MIQKVERGQGSLMDRHLGLLRTAISLTLAS
jgi:hypothetical protein